jgi:galactosyl transferase GMA12/MNN10 family
MGICLAGVSMLGFRIWVVYSNSKEDLTKTPFYTMARTNGPCPAQKYILQKKPIDPHDICLTTLTDEAGAGWYQQLFRLRNFDNLLDITWENKRRYADQHGYRLFNESQRSLDTTRPPSWSKTRAVKRLLLEEKCEWVFWMDADTVIMNSSISLESFLPEDFDLLLTEEKG